MSPTNRLQDDWRVWQTRAAHDAAQQAGSVGLTPEVVDMLIGEHAGYGGDDLHAVARAIIAEFCRLNNYPLPKEQK